MSGYLVYKIKSIVAWFLGVLVKLSDISQKIKIVFQDDTGVLKEIVIKITSSA